MPVHVLILVGVLFLVFLLLRYTMLGRGIYAIGGDEAAAERAGFNVRAIKMFLYCLVGALAGVTGIVRISMMDYADPSTMLGMELTVIAAVVLGGTRVTGGLGTLTGTILGVALMTILENSLILHRHPDLLEPRLHRRDHHHRHGGDGAADRPDAAARSRPLPRPRREREHDHRRRPRGPASPRQPRPEPGPPARDAGVRLRADDDPPARPVRHAGGLQLHDEAIPEYGIMAVGMSLTMITGGIDLGVVGTANLSAIVAATFLIGDRA